VRVRPDLPESGIDPCGGDKGWRQGSPGDRVVRRQAMRMPHQKIWGGGDVVGGTGNTAIKTPPIIRGDGRCERW
jgi:hypothetical protein